MTFVRPVPSLALLFAVTLTAASPAPGALPTGDSPPEVTDPPSIRAVHASTGSPSLDGRLDDEVWQFAMVADTYRQDYPDDGQPATERTEVRVLYDQAALYVGARLFDSDPSGIVGRLGRRDSETSSDLFVLSIDSYHDHRTAFRFGVNPAGVRSDWMAVNDADTEDFSWNPVWEVVTSVDSLGWTAEIRIPFSQLRFGRANEHEWGVNFTRLIFRKSEWNVWSWWENEEQGFASHFGHLTGLTGLTPPRRLEVLPYLVTSSDHVEGADRRNPFHDGSRQSLSGGLDLNFGLTSNLTVNATVNPDFGQVEADPAVVNLTAFETLFEERRPFFVEGANLFEFGAGSGGFIFGAPRLFYSRRIGRAPSRRVSEPGGFVDMPANTSILAATKLSGQSGNWSIGLLDAVTGNEHADVQQNDGTRRSELVEPRSNYGVASLRRDFRDGSTGVGFLGTALHRNTSNPGFASLSSAAYAGGFDLFHRFSDNRYVVTATLSASHVRGKPAAMIRAQRSSARYYQRPDQDYVSVDSAATSLSGYATSFQFSKVSGNWLIGTDLFAYSPGFEINDVGFQRSVDQVFHGVRLTRRWLDPGSVFRAFFVNATWAQTWNFGGTRLGRNVFFGVSGRFLNYWMVQTRLDIGLGGQNAGGTRGGPLMESPRRVTVGATVETDTRKSFWGGAVAMYSSLEHGGWSLETGSGLNYRPTSRLHVSLSPSFDRSRSVAFYVTQRQDPTATHTFGHRYVFADLRQTIISTSLRLELALTPNMSIQWWGQPFVATGNYGTLKEFAEPGTFDFHRYGEDGGSTVSTDDETGIITVDPDGPGEADAFSIADPDFRMRSLRSNLVFRWEYRPGSTLFVVWNHGRSGFVEDSDFRAFDEMGRVFGDPMQNTFLVKLNYWFSR